MQMRNEFWKEQAIALIISILGTMYRDSISAQKRTRINAMLFIVLPVVVVIIARMIALVVVIVPIIGSDRVRQRSHHAAPDVGRHLRGAVRSEMRAVKPIGRKNRGGGERM